MTRKGASDKYIDDLERKMVDNRRVRIKRSEDKSAIASVLDTRTSLVLNDFLNRGEIKQLIGILSAGKESNVYLGIYKDNSEIAIKVYKIESHIAKWVQDYLRGDSRFENVGNSISQVIFSWAKKEFKNLQRTYGKGLLVPKPLNVKKNVLLMEFIGQSGTPAPRLKDGPIPEDLDSYYNQVIAFMKDLYHKSKLVHADLSEFNILYWKGRLFFIDMSQSVLIDHPKALFYLARDIKNVNSYFEKNGVTVIPPNEIYDEIIQME